ncbi:ABC transporter ATP-binding protein [Romboutsia lituseburensis]|uniref:ABC-2 type transport system ATP-binding protein n=1 Tax=Romboutsia lituseburensis DSM 797 TaxID=1121325 RepID=A0A1G9MVA3_9FIRM|nr:ABC transporter ATP-binding protein [Romboutsia lituseburensis]CEH34305.1 ABC transporter G member 20 [Romboutsia lituseburensis]SDL78054.1 ABC-2 type transport system ATP-binding protein [Romboutsia lituseburensis DSM 797]
MSNNVAVKVCNLDVEYDKVKILNNINLNIKEGEIIGLLGPSGSGKTTLVKTIIGMKGFVKGKVVVLDEKMPTLKVVNDIGYMAQSDALYDDLTGIDNVLFFAELYGIKGKIAKQRAMEVLELVDLQKHAKRPVKNYSGGMKRRLSLAIALVHSPKLLILDEPTVGIDPILRKKFWDEFNRIKNSGGTIIVTTHVMDEAYKCNKLALIRNGKIIAEGSPNEIITASGGQTIEDAFLFYSTDEGEE